MPIYKDTGDSAADFIDNYEMGLQKLLDALIRHYLKAHCRFPLFRIIEIFKNMTKSIEGKVVKSLKSALFVIPANPGSESKAGTGIQ
jgi:hypothetical protein